MSVQNRATGLLDDYANIRTLPATLSVAFVIASLYQFGGISTVELVWLGSGGTEQAGYNLTTEHSVFVSIGAFAVAFMSSKTKQFENYETVEQLAIAAGPAVILGHQYTTEVSDFLTGIGDPLGLQLAFVATLVSWGVAVR